MKLYNLDNKITVEQNGSYYVIEDLSWDELLNQKSIYKYLLEKINSIESAGNDSWTKSKTVSVPIGTQEVWAAGVTYLRSKVARMEESEESGGATFYDKVYDAERPELFFKANAHRVIASGAKCASGKIVAGMYPNQNWF
ncbi:hypothetical protein [Niabella ginsengisoli]|uniref:Uncharacterized protein n=1 Tax=Niabella ginsengisoli TaxID=522298 RepID=A0ABS9SHH6_9BACT|nr:hypothetical protein [Niabella ginsengisoli]MCH5597818.1 hypothetical protein [Niabella ginsengisoli]